MDDLKRQAILNYLRGNEFFSTITNIEKKLDAWADAYPIDILSELKKANAWLLNKSARYRDYGRFLNGWLARSAGPPEIRPPSVNEVLKKLTTSLDIKEGLKTKKVNERARIMELKEQAARLLSQNHSEGENAKTETEK